MRITDVLSKNNPETKSVAYTRQAIVAGSLLLAAVTGGKAIDAMIPDSPPRPTHGVVVEPGDPSPVWHAAKEYTREQGGDPRDVAEQIEAASQSLQDGFANPGDVMNVPMTDAEIAQREAEQNQNQGS